METILALVTESEATKTDLCHQLSSLLEGYMTVVRYATERGVDAPVKADLVVFSSLEMYEIAKELVDPSCPMIIANRSLNMSHLDQLFNIPDGTDVLVVNDLINNAKEVIKLLTEVGVDHLKYHAYAPGESYDEHILYAVTPAEVALIPKHIPQKIDLGARIIDITTIIEILTRLNLVDAKAHYISAKYVETIIRLNKRLHDSIDEAMLTNRYLNKVLNHVDDGMIAYDKVGRITVFNETSEAIFGMRASTAVGKTVTQVVKDANIRAFMLQKTEVDEIVGKIGENQYIIGKMALDKLNSYVCTFKDTRDSMNMEKKLRQMMMKRGLVAKYQFEDIIGISPVMNSVIETAKKLAITDLSILIQGESGVGKEMFASAIHNASQRANGPFLAINFSALPEELAESELFGYEEGSFTGAKKGGKKGLFEEANGGTIFLDEIGDVSPRIQARLLRVLQEKEIRRIGGAEIISVNVRVIAATHRDLKKMCQDGSFREDLYHRLRKLYLRVPPLREHLEDLDLLIAQFLRNSGQGALKLSLEVLDALKKNHWRGNIRELQNLVDYLQAVCTEGEVKLSDLPEDYFEELEMNAQAKHDSTVGQSHIHERFTSEEVMSMSNQIILTEEDRFILRNIHRVMKMGQSVGRETISMMAQDEFPKLTPNRVRKRVAWLTTNGLIVKSKGRKGMSLTEEGMRVVV